MDKRKKIFSIDQLNDEVGRKEIKDFFVLYKFCVIKLDEDTRKNAILKKMSEKAGFWSNTYKMYCYKYIGVIGKGEGTTLFNSTHHRSSTYVDPRMLPHKHLSEVFTNEAFLLLQDLNKNICEIHIRGMRQAWVRETNHTKE